MLSPAWLSAWVMWAPRSSRAPVMLLATSSTREAMAYVDGLDRLTPRQSLAVYRIVQEALTNVVRHAQARNVWAAVRNEDGHLIFSVEDDGIGIPPDRLTGTPAFGLNGMRERALSVGASVDIAPRSPEGTRVRLTMPLGLIEDQREENP